MAAENGNFVLLVGRNIDVDRICGAPLDELGSVYVKTD